MDREVDKNPEQKSDTLLDSEELDEVSGGAERSGKIKEDVTLIHCPTD